MYVSFGDGQTDNFYDVSLPLEMVSLLKAVLQSATRTCGPGQVLNTVLRYATRIRGPGQAAQGPGPGYHTYAQDHAIRGLVHATIKIPSPPNLGGEEGPIGKRTD